MIKRSIPARLMMAGCACIVCASASALTIDLSLEIRDFRDTHPDMEAFLGTDPGIVLPTLGADRNPVYAGTSGNPTTTGATNFNQWYNDDPVNFHTLPPFILTLDNTITPDPDVYTFVDTSFFPIDGLGFGNEGRSHNYHFTAELHTVFTYSGGEVFTFTGDDDLWVFIDDTLVIDLGGVHGALTDSVLLDALGLTLGEDYTLDLFFAERHTVASSFRIDTSIRLRPADPPVPEPASMSLLGLGLAGLAAKKMRKALIRHTPVFPKALRRTNATPAQGMLSFSGTGILPVCLDLHGRGRTCHVTLRSCTGARASCPCACISTDDTRSRSAASRSRGGSCATWERAEFGGTAPRLPGKSPFEGGGTRFA